MVDNVKYPESGATDIATHDFAAVQYQKMLANFLAGGNVPINVSTLNGLPIAPSAGIAGAFGEFRTSEPKTLFSSIPRYDEEGVLFENNVVGSATINHDANKASVSLNVTALVGDTATRQSRVYIPYQAGHGQVFRFKFMLGSPLAGLERCVGCYDDDNGFFLLQDGTVGLKLVHRTSTSGSVVNTEVLQSAWNLDPLDGTGSSQATLDISKAQHMIIDFGGSVGSIRVGFEITGRIVYSHVFLFSNTLTEQFIQHSFLPIRYELITDGTNAGSMEEYSSTALSESGFIETLTNTFGADTGIVATSVSGSDNVLIAIRPKLTINSIVNRALIALRSFSFLSTEKAVRIRVIYGATLTGGLWTDVNSSFSSVELNTTVTSISGGVEAETIYSKGESNAGSDIRNKYPLALNSAGGHPTTPLTDTIAIVVDEIGGVGSSDSYAAMEWTELV